MSTSLGIALLVWALMRQVQESRPWLGFALGWPSTVLHELAHFGSALLLGASPSSFSVWPKRVGPNLWQLGSVAFQARFWTAGWVALAPLLWAGAAYFVITSPHQGFAHAAARGVLGGVLLAACVPSSTDLRIAVRYPAALLLIFSAAAIYLATP